MRIPHQRPSSGRGKAWKGLLLLIGTSIFFFQATAQQSTIEGQVIDSASNAPLPGVSVKVKTSATGVSTDPDGNFTRSEENTSELQSLMRISYAVFCLKKKN